MIDINQELLKIVDKSDILIDEPMTKHTSFKVGGKADYFVTIRNTDILKKIQKLVKKENIPFFIIGNGSNLLVLDKGIRGIVGKLKFEKVDFSKNIVRVSSDIAGSKLARMCCKNGLSRSRIYGWNTRNDRWGYKNECRSTWL